MKLSRYRGEADAYRIELQKAQKGIRRLKRKLDNLKKLKEHGIKEVVPPHASVQQFLMNTRKKKSVEA